MARLTTCVQELKAKKGDESEKESKKSSNGIDSDSLKERPPPSQPKIPRRAWQDELKHTITALEPERAASETRGGGVCAWEQRCAVIILRVQAGKLVHLT